ncbi:MAG: hypothetical protein ACSLFD_07015 [Solirubrobacterales bacterium]
MDREQGVTKVRTAALAASLAIATLLAMTAPNPAEAASTYPDAVLLVSGFQTETAFTSPSPTCAGRMGSTFGIMNGIGPALRAAGYDVFTAPETKIGDKVPTPCTAEGDPVPASNMVIQTNGETVANGAALARYIGFLQDEYGVTDLHLVGHSDGGLWSRSAITQNSAYSGLTVQSLTTLGTPHTGSYLADLAMELNNGQCDFSNPVEQDICDVVVPLADLIVAELGPTATAELSNDYLATFNPQQQIGNCPVSTIGGDHVSFGIPFFSYYTPSDGLVGIASALAKSARDFNGSTIPAPNFPDHRQAGVYDVVHGASMSIFSKKTLLNQPEISQQVTNNTLLTGSEACNQPSGVAAPPRQNQTLRAPLYRMVAAKRNGRRPAAGDEDFVVSGRGVKVSCGSKTLPGVPLMGDRRLRIHNAGKCSGRLKASGKGVSRAVMLRSNPARHVTVRLAGDRARIVARGKQPRSLRAQSFGRGKWQALKLNRRSWAKLPEVEGGFLKLRIRTRGGNRNVPADTANLTLRR